MLSTFSNSSLYPILEAYESMYAADALAEVNEALTIPMNPNDDLEKQLYAKLDRNYKYADAIVRWFRNDRKALNGDDELQRTYVYNLKNITDLLKDYDSYIAELQKNKALKDTISLPTADGKFWKMNPVKDFPSIRKLEGLKALVKHLGNLVHSGSAIKTTVSKYAVTDADRGNIRLVGFSENVAVWATRTFESTNKFVFQLWRNADTMDRGDAYGDKSVQSPYCTHAVSHWKSYSEGYNDYQQYWFLKRITRKDVVDNRITYNQIQYTVGDLSNPNVVAIFNAMAGTGPDTLIAMNDTGDDFLDSEDSDFDNYRELGIYGNEVAKLDETLFDRIGETALYYDRDTKKMEVDNTYENDTQVFLKSDGIVKKGKNDVVVTNVSIDDYNITRLPKGLPRKILGDFNCSGCSRLESLEGIPSEIGGNIILVKCDSLDYKEISKVIDVKKQVRKILGEFALVKDITESGDSISFLIPFDELEGIYDKNSRDALSFDQIRKILTGDVYDVFYFDDVEIGWNYHTSPFDERLKDFGLEFSDMERIYEGDYDKLIDEGKIDEYKADRIRELLENDFYEGNGIYAVCSSCMENGTANEAYGDIMNDLLNSIPADRGYGIQYDKGDGKLYIRVILDRNGMTELVKNYNPETCNNVLKCFNVDSYGDYDTIAVYEPQYGWSGFDDDDWKEALTSFADDVYKIMSEKSAVKDAKGQQFFDFDKKFKGK